jgi:glyoxylase-like metal-dependent hydrolase (beta-lactamase superfamily II)
VFDGGTLHIPDPSRFQLTKADVPVTDLVTPCYLIVHPKGTLIWDACAVPDEEWKATGGPVEHQLQLPDGQTRDLTLRSQLRTQLNSVGYTPSDITYLALSHYHYDHTANADQFGTATWLVRQAEREAMFAENAPPGTRPATYANLRGSKTVVIDTDDYDVFGDGSVVIKSAVGHTPGHQMLFLRLAGTGSVLLCGDLYHYEQERTLDRVPTFEFNADQTRAARTALENFLRQSGAQMWIQHDLTANARLKKAPAFYD